MANFPSYAESIALDIRMYRWGGMLEMKRIVWLLGSVGLVLAMVSGWSLTEASSPYATVKDPALAANSGIHKIKHVVIIMQENRSFDSYFGTFPGADGIPMNNGVPSVCVPNAQTGQCVRPFHDRYDLDAGGPHSSSRTPPTWTAARWMDSSTSDTSSALSNAPSRPTRIASRWAAPIRST